MIEVFKYTDDQWAYPHKLKNNYLEDPNIVLIELDTIKNKITVGGELEIQYTNFERTMLTFKNILWENILNKEYLVELGFKEIRNKE